MAMPDLNKLKASVSKATSVFKNLDTSAKDNIAQTLANNADSVVQNGYIDNARPAISKLHREGGFGEIDQAVLQSLYGLNHRGNILAVPANRNSFGMTFFTRPRLNLSYDNVTAVRTFTPLLNRNESSIPRVIRSYLDPVGSRKVDGTGYPCKLINEKSPFIAVLSNNLLSLSGWPDPFVDNFTSKQGMYREEWTIIDGFARIFNSFELTANFRNIVGDPISKLLHIWTQYGAYVHEGVMDPYPDAILENEVDYDTRIYRVILNAERNHVEEIAATGAAYPITNNLGAHFNFDSEKPFVEELNQISATFKCMGVDYNDPILVQEFNETVCMFEIAMADGIRETYFKKMNAAEADLFNGRGLPRIDPNTMEFEWWLPMDEYVQLMNSAKK